MNNGVKLAIALVLLAGAAALGVRALGPKSYSDANPNDVMSYYICGNDGCENTFQYSMREVRDIEGKSETGIPPCPDCGSLKVIAAAVCKDCKGYLPTGGHGQLPERCPHCNVQLSRNAGTFDGCVEPVPGDDLG